MLHMNDNYHGRATTAELRAMDERAAEMARLVEARGKYSRDQLMGRNLQALIANLASDEEQDQLVAAMRAYGLFVPPVLL